MLLLIILLFVIDFDFEIGFVFIFARNEDGKDSDSRVKDLVTKSLL